MCLLRQRRSTQYRVFGNRTGGIYDERICVRPIYGHDRRGGGDSIPDNAWPGGFPAIRRGDSVFLGGACWVWGLLLHPTGNVHGTTELHRGRQIIQRDNRQIGAFRFRCDGMWAHRDNTLSDMRFSCVPSGWCGANGYARTSVGGSGE